MKIHTKFLINLYNFSFLKVFIVFFFIILITNVLEQLEFFKNINLSFIYLIFLSLLNTPSILFEILPFIFLLSTQVFFIYLIDKNELQIFKYNGLTNLKIIKILSIYTFILGFIFIFIFYNFSSSLKNSFLLIKNSYTSDQKYLAVITENGLWIKDEINGQINIINAEKFNDHFLLNVSITQFDKNFDIFKIINSTKVDVSTNNWKIFKPVILKDNQESAPSELILQSNFDFIRINSLFSNLSSLTMFELLKLRDNHISLNYSIVDIDSHLYKIFSYPIFFTLITIFSAVIMFNIGYQKNYFFNIVLGVFLSVIIYYISYFFHILGTNEKIPLILSILLPLAILLLLNLTTIIKLNEK